MINTEKKGLFEEIIEEWDAIIILLVSIVAIIIDIFVDLPDGSISTLVLVIVVAISIRQIRSGIKTDKQFVVGLNQIGLELQERNQNNNVTKQQLFKQNSQILGQVELVRDTLQRQHAHEGEICDQRLFYVHLTDALSRARFTVDLTQLDAAPPQAYGLKEKVDYFNLSTQTVIEKPHIRFRRIVAIPNMEKLNWVRDVLEQVENFANFNLHYVDVSTERFFMPPLSLQIIDRRELCMVDPTRGFLPIAGGDKSLWIRSDPICEIFSEYYEKFWSLTTPLKEGGIIYWDVLDNIEKELKNHHSTNFPN